MFMPTVVPKSAAAATVPKPPPCPTPPEKLINMLSMQDAADATGCMRDEFLDALVLKIAEVDFSAMEPEAVDNLGNAQGIYWLIGMFAGKPCFKQENGSLLLWWLRDKQEGGWYISDKMFSSSKDKGKADVTMVENISYKQLIF